MLVAVLRRAEPPPRAERDAGRGDRLRLRTNWLLSFCCKALIAGALTFLPAAKKFDTCEEAWLKPRHGQKLCYTVAGKQWKTGNTTKRS